MKDNKETIYKNKQDTLRKEPYVPPIVEVITFEKEDIITVSTFDNKMEWIYDEEGQ